MALKMLTFLGTNLYKECTYSFDNQSCSSPFVQIALAHILKPEIVCVFVTTGEGGSRIRNWEGKQVMFKDGAQTPSSINGLEVLSAQVAKTRFQAVDIPDGGSMEELWEIFDHLLESVDDGDEIIFDVTHSFRSLPIMALAGIQYVRTLKNITLRGIYYGAYEARNQQSNTAPIFDLTAFVTLMDWSQAVNAFTVTGNIEGMKNLLQAEATPRCRASCGQDPEGCLLRDLGKGLDAFIQDLATCRGRHIYDTNHSGNLATLIEDLRQCTSLAALKPLLDLLEGKIRSLEVTGSECMTIIRRGFEAVRWCMAHGQIQQAYTFLQENIITYVCLIRGRHYLDREIRRQCSDALLCASQKKGTISEAEREWVCDLHEEVISVFDTLSKRRNDINHCGITEPGTNDKLHRDLDRILCIMLSHLRLD